MSINGKFPPVFQAFHTQPLQGVTDGLVHEFWHNDTTRQETLVWETAMMCVTLCIESGLRERGY